MAIKDILASIEAMPFAVAIAQSAWMFPTIETIHVLALGLVIGSIAMVDLRLIGVSRRDQGVLELTNSTLPWTWAGFGFAVTTGLLMFSSAATKYFDNIPFRIKMLLLLAVGINMAVFHLKGFKTVDRWDYTLPPPRAARVAGALSLTFWASIVFFGRWIGFV